MTMQILISLGCAVKSGLYIFLSLCQGLLKVDLWGWAFAVQTLEELQGNLEKSEKVPGYLRTINSLLWGEELMTWISKLQPCIPHNVVRKRFGSEKYRVCGRSSGFCITSLEKASFPLSFPFSCSYCYLFVLFNGISSVFQLKQNKCGNRRNCRWVCVCMRFKGQGEKVFENNFLHLFFAAAFFGFFLHSWLFRLNECIK